MSDTEPAAASNVHYEDPLVSVEDLEVHYPITEGLLRREVGRVRAVDGVSFEIRRGEALGLVGESGSGKTTVAHSILQLETPTAGDVYFDGDRLSTFSERELAAFRRRAQLIVQDPNEAFNPRMTVGDAVAEPLELHGMDDKERRDRIVADLLERVGLSATDRTQYPHEFSGGEKQRIAIARALVLNPDLIVADEPTSALDGRVQADILELLAEIRTEYDIAVLFISHDLDVIRRFCDRVAVMYLGEIVEKGPKESVLSTPVHPYTRVLLGSVPSLDPGDRSFVRPLTDTVPDPSDPPSGCRFHTRCPEIIQPAAFDLDHEEWQSIAKARFVLQTGELPGELAVLSENDRTTDRIREAFELPETFDDEAVDSTIEAAVAAIARGDLEAAADRLAETFRSPCETEMPESVIVDGQSVQCHRYDEGTPGVPMEWTEK